MTKISQFKALVYNQDKIKDVSNVVCPPYDVILPEYQDKLFSRSPFNFIHVLLAKDTQSQDRYLRSAAIFKDWIKDQILITDRTPAIYFYSQAYNVKGENKTRFGFIALLRLEDKNSGVFAHEHTRVKPKEDRLRLIRAVKANLSPIFVVFGDKKRIIQKVNTSVKDKLPFIEAVDDEKTTHRVWRIDDEQLLAEMRANLDNENLFIADGHHRYEVSCIYRDEMIKAQGKTDPDAPYNYTLAYFTNVDPRGLTIFAIHRLIKLSRDVGLDQLNNQLKEYFDIEEVKDSKKFFFLLEKAGSREHVIGMYRQKKYFLLRLKNIKIIDQFSTDKSPAYRSLDVSILNNIVFNHILHLDLDGKDAVVYSNNPDEITSGADNDPSAIGFFLNPVKIEQIMSVALSGEKMPPKSTYFYPKVLSGLVVHNHNNVNLKEQE